LDGREHSSGRASSSRRKAQAWALGAISAAALAAVGAFFNVLGNKAAEGIGHSEGAPISWSVEEMSTECFGSTFLPGEAAREALGHPPPADWKAFEETPGAAPANRDLIQVAIQGETERKVTLTGIRFHVKRASRPDGVTFGNPCGGPLTGRAMVVDLDEDPPKIIASSEEVGANVSFSREGRSPDSKPIRFPWTVSVTDPLLLEIVASSERCYCTWTAEIPWVSGSKRGVIPIDSDGSGFTVAAGTDLDGYTNSSGSWRRSPS
jgi:hypothetical protein